MTSNLVGADGTSLAKQMLDESFAENELDRRYRDDQIKREKIPTVEDLKTQYRSRAGWMMVLPLPNTTKIGNIHLADRHIREMTEGHIVFIPETMTTELQVGDCVLWPEHNCMPMQVDGGPKFVLVQPEVCVMSIKKSVLESSRDARQQPDTK